MFGFATKEEIRKLDIKIRQEVLDSWQKEVLNNLAVIKDPHKQLIMLENNIKAVDTEIIKEENKISKTVKRKENIINAISLGATAFAGLLFITSGGSVLIPTVLTMSAIAGLTQIAPRITASSKKRLNLENSELICSLKSTENVFLELGKEITKQNLTEIAETAAVIDSSLDPNLNPGSAPDYSLKSIFARYTKNSNNVADRILASEIFKTSTKIEPSPSI